MNKLVTRLTSAAAACLVVVAGVAVAQSTDTSGAKGTSGPDTGASPTLPDPNNTMPAAPSSTTTPSSTSSPSTPSTTDSSTAPADSSLPARSDRN